MMVWMDGSLVTAAEAKVPVTTHAIHYGTSAFEGVRAYRSGDELLVFRLPDHLARLRRSARAYGLEYPYSDAALTSAALELCRANRLHGNSYLRPFCFVGDHGIKLDVTGAPVSVAVLAFEMDEIYPRAGVSAGVSSWMKFSDRSTPPQAKMGGNYLNSALAAAEARRHGYDEAILLDAAGNVSEASGENIFVVSGGRLRTPPTSSSALGGITRDTVMVLADEAQMPVSVEPVPRSALYSADEIFLTGTATGIVPVLSVDGIRVGEGGVERRDPPSRPADSALDVYRRTFRAGSPYLPSPRVDDLLKKKEWVTGEEMARRYAEIFSGAASGRPSGVTGEIARRYSELVSGKGGHPEWLTAVYGS